MNDGFPKDLEMTSDKIYIKLDLSTLDVFYSLLAYELFEPFSNIKRKVLLSNLNFAICLCIVVYTTEYRTLVYSFYVLFFGYGSAQTNQ